jgi:16S rRNA (cytidine1402-2'-O)-methyltransferase
MPGTLYVVATPLGNLEDVTQRALRVLREVDIVAAEDTRHSRKLLEHFGIRATLTSYHDQVEAKKAPELVRALEEGKSVALISDAGTPAICDPGYRLVRAAAAAGIRVVPVPGPSAVAAALSVSGLPADRFVFEGFLPPKSGRRRARIEALAREPRTLVFYEAPHRVRETLAELQAILGEREACVVREATKLYETVARGSLAELSAQSASMERGEVTIVVAGAPEVAAEAPPQLDDEIEALRRQGRRTRDIADILAARHGLPRHDVYQRIIRRADEPR